MSFNGSGVFSRLYSWVTDASNNILIRSDRMDADSNDIAAGLTNALCKDGQSTPTANLKMGGFRFTGLGAGVAATDAATVKQTQSNAPNYAVATGTANAIVIAMTPTNTALTDGQGFTFMASLLNTGAVTLAVDGLTAHAIVTSAGSALVGGEIIANGMYDVVYSVTNTNFTLLNSALSATAPTNITGNAGTATKLQTARAINGVNFDGSAAINIPAASGYNPQSSTYAPTTTDLGKLVDFTGSSNTTWTMTSAATLGSAFVCYLRNNGTSNAQLLLKSSSGTLDGIAAISGFVMYAGEERIIFSDGTNFETLIIKGGSAVFTSSGTWTRPPGYNKFFVELIGGGGSGAVRSTTGNAAGGGGGGYFSSNIPASAFVAAGSSETITVAGAAASVASSNANGIAGNHSAITINGNAYTTTGGVAATHAATGSAAVAGSGDSLITLSVGYILFSSDIGVGAGGGVTTGNVASAGVGGASAGGGGASSSSNNTAAAGGVPAFSGPAAAGVGGARGASSGASNGGNGVAPGGGGGGAVEGGASGSGAAGQVIITGIV